MEKKACKMQRKPETLWKNKLKGHKVHASM